MSQEVAKFDFDDKQIDLIKNTICKGATNVELQLFLHTCKRVQLDPMLRQIYSLVRRAQDDNGDWKETRFTIAGIDGLRVIADRTGRYSPGGPAIFEYDKEGKLISATVSIKKYTSDGTWHEVSTVAYYEEFVKRNKKGDPTSVWKTMPHLMLAKCAEAQSLRKAFPYEMGGVYAAEEIEAEVEVAEPAQPEEEIDLPLPANADKEAVELYIAEIATKCKKSCNSIRKSALGNLEGFFTKFSQWQENRIKQLEEIPA